MTYHYLTIYPPKIGNGTCGAVVGLAEAEYDPDKLSEADKDPDRLTDVLGLGPDGDIEADCVLEGDKDKELDKLREIEADSDGLGPLGEIEADCVDEIEALALPTEGDAEIEAE